MGTTLAKFNESKLTTANLLKNNEDDDIDRELQNF